MDWDFALSILAVGVVLLAPVYAGTLVAAGIAALAMGLDRGRGWQAVVWMNAVTSPGFAVVFAGLVLTAGPRDVPLGYWAAGVGTVLAVLAVHAVILRWTLGLEVRRAALVSLGINAVPSAAALVLLATRALGAW